jgi:plasmid stability protein
MQRLIPRHASASSINQHDCKLDDGVKAKLEVRAGRHGRSKKAREIVKAALVSEEPRAQNLAQATHRHIEPNLRHQRGSVHRNTELTIVRDKCPDRASEAIGLNEPCFAGWRNRIEMRVIVLES